MHTTRSAVRPSAPATLTRLEIPAPPALPRELTSTDATVHPEFLVARARLLALSCAPRAASPVATTLRPEAA